ncbi:hypothetical protein BC829DRAFT_61105 [Chytridium lagenaria]|nr:hypothetical protein BC829DRAFT_61105 [Chytridium lagenaria]
MSSVLPPQGFSTARRRSSIQGAPITGSGSPPFPAPLLPKNNSTSSGGASRSDKIVLNPVSVPGSRKSSGVQESLLSYYGSRRNSSKLTSGSLSRAGQKKSHHTSQIIKSAHSFHNSNTPPLASNMAFTMSRGDNKNRPAPLQQPNVRHAKRGNG